LAIDSFGLVLPFDLAGWRIRERGLSTAKKRTVVGISVRLNMIGNNIQNHKGLSLPDAGNNFVRKRKPAFSASP